MSITVMQLPLSGTGLPGVNSIAGPVEGSTQWAPNMAVAAYEDSSLRLWDTRGPARPAAFVAASKMPSDDTLEVANTHDGRCTVALSGNSVVSVDWRNVGKGFVGRYNHGKEVSAMDKRWISRQSGESHDYWFVDEDGGIFALGKGSALSVLSTRTLFGAHRTLPCGLAVLQQGNVVVSVGMDMEAHVHATADGSQLCSAVPIGVMDVVGGQATQQLANPPIPTCADVVGDVVAIGRGDGTFVLHSCGSNVTTGFDFVLESSGHASNGLVGIAWTNTATPSMLVSGAMSGEVYVWDTRAALGLPGAPATTDDGNEDDEEDLPCLAGFDVRQDFPVKAGSSADVTLNCVASWAGVVFAGDTAGRILGVPVDLGA